MCVSDHERVFFFVPLNSKTVFLGRFLIALILLFLNNASLVLSLFPFSLSLPTFLLSSETILPMNLRYSLRLLALLDRSLSLLDGT